MSILIVDDFEEQREMLALTLRAAGYRSLLFAGSDTDSVGNPVGDVLTAFADNSGAPTFVGGATHQVIGCSLTLKPAVAKAASAQVSADVIRSASQVRDLSVVTGVDGLRSLLPKGLLGDADTNSQDAAS